MVIQHTHLKIVFILTFILFISFYGCMPQENDFSKNIERTEKAAKLSGVETSALVVFYMGHCYVLHDNGWEDLIIGQFLAQNDTIKVDKDSYLEIKLGNKAIICIEENSEIRIQSLLYEIDKKVIQLYLKQGSVFSSLGKLLSNESFEIVTPNVILSVRGTQFIVKESKAETLVAVKEGSVSLLPPGLSESTNVLLENENREMINEIIDSLIKEGPILEKEKEIVITREKAGLMSESVRSLVSFVIDNNKSPDNFKEKEFVNQTKLVSEALNRLGEGITDWTDESEKDFLSPRFSNIENFNSDLSINAVPFNYGNPIIIEIEVDSDDGFVFIDDMMVGKKRIGALYDKVKKYTFVVKCPGYKDTQFDIKTKAGTHYSYNVLLQENVKNEMSIISNKDKVDIKGEDNEKSESNTTSEFTKELKTLIADYENKQRYNISNAAIIGQIEHKDNVIYLADKYGSLFAIDGTGKKKWTIPTNNNPNEHSYPLILGDNIYFTGSDELVITDCATGTQVKRKTLNVDEAHYFGRRIISYKDYGIFPANTALKIMDMDSGEFIRDIPCPDGIRMTPVIYKNRIIIVDQKGVLAFINPETGSIEKTIPTHAGKPIALPGTIKDDFLYFADSSGHIVCINLKSEKIAWEKDLIKNNTTVYHRLECGDNSVNIFTRGTLISLDRESGKEYFPPIANLSAPPLFIAGKLIFGTLDGFLVFLNEEDGKVLVSINVEQKITTRPVIADNKLLLGTESGNVFIIPLIMLDES